MKRNFTIREKIPSVFHMEMLNSVDLFEMSIAEIQSHLSRRSFTSKDYVNFCFERIRRTDPLLEAVMERNLDAVEIAAALDKERQEGKVRSQLHGIPILVNDNIATKDKMQTTCGSWALLGSTVPRDAFIVSQLRRAGAIIIGYANMTEGASTRSTEYSDGYSARRGQVRNPYDLSQSSSGSSGGSAAAVAANLVPLAIGTDTDGSIAGPAQITGLVCIKPTPGLTSRMGTIPISETMDTVGVLAKTVADAVIGLNAMVGEDPDDPLTMCSKDLRHEDYSKFIKNKDALKGAKFGLPMKYCWDSVPDDQRAVVDTLFSHLEAEGAKIIEVDYPCAEGRIGSDGKWNWELGTPAQSEFTSIRTETNNGVNAYLSELENTEMKDFKDLLEYNQRNTGTEVGDAGDLPAIPTGQDTFEKIAAHKDVKDQDYHDALEYTRKQTRENGIDAALRYDPEKTIQLDALILCDRRLVGQKLAAQAGYPTITIPVGQDRNGMPVGITLQQTAWREEDLIKWASAIEDARLQAMGPRPVPTYRNNLAKNIPIDKLNTRQSCEAKVGDVGTSDLEERFP